MWNFHFPPNSHYTGVRAGFGVDTAPPTCAGQSPSHWGSAPPRREAEMNAEEWGVIEAGSLCPAHHQGHLLHSWSSLNFGFHIIITPFYKRRNARLREQRGVPWGHMETDPLSRLKFTSLHPRCPAPWVSAQPRVLQAGNKSKTPLETRIHSPCCLFVISNYYPVSPSPSRLHPELAGPPRCADMLLGRTCSSRSRSSSSPLGQAVCTETGRGGGGGGLLIQSLSSFI